MRGRLHIQKKIRTFAAIFSNIEKRSEVRGQRRVEVILRIKKTYYIYGNNL